MPKNENIVPKNSLKLPQRVIDELARSGPLNGKVLAQRLREPLVRVQCAISGVNHNKKRNVQIIRLGKWGNCGYELVTRDTNSDDIKDNIDDNDNRAIKHIKKRSKLYKLGKETRTARAQEEFMNKVLNANLEVLSEIQREFRTNKN